MNFEEAKRYYNSISNYPFFKPVYLASETVDGYHVLTDAKGYVLSKKEWEAIKIQTDRFYQGLSDDDIDHENKEIHDEQIRLFEERSKALDVKKKGESHQGYVYFLMADNGMVKIGETKDIKKRLDQFTVQLPYKLKLIHYIQSDNCSVLEEQFHQKFADKRRRGEWFELSDKDIEEVKNHE